MHLELRYVTRFLYPSPVWDSHNALRARPTDDDHQTTSAYEVRLTPEARIFTYTDSWGTEVNTFSITQPHEELIVEALATVDTRPRPSAPDEVPASELFEDSFRESNWMYLQPSSHVRWTPEIQAAARDLAAADGSVRDRAERMCRFVHGHLDYRAGTTVVGTSVAELWEGDSGVCQDFSHLTIALLRSAGVPARYVSGYLYAADPSAVTQADDDEVVVQTHAWVEANIPGWGWWALDPTNLTEVGERHVTIGRGRDYEDVMPLRGVYHGDSVAELAVEVTMGHRLASVTRLPDLTVDQ